MRFKQYILVPIALVILLISRTHTSFSQNYSEPWHYKILNGLTANSLYEFFQDHNGNLWFGSDNGAYIYNGENFRLLTVQDGLADNLVIRVFEDSKGRVWFNHLDKLPSYLEDGVIHTTSTKTTKVLSDPNSRFLELDNGSVILGGINGFFEFTLDGKTVVHEKNPLVYYTTIAKIGSKIYYYGKGGDFKLNSYQFSCVRDLALNLAIEKGLISVKTFYTSFPIVMSLFDSKGNLTGKSKNFPQLPNLINTYGMIERNGFLYFCSIDGLIIYQYKDGQLVYSKTILEGIPVSSIAFNQKNDLFVNTLGEGMYHFPNSSFKRVEEIAGSVIYDYAVHKGDLYCAGAKGKLFVKREGRFQKIADIEQKINQLIDIYQIKSFGDNLILTTSQGAILFNTKSLEYDTSYFTSVGGHKGVVLNPKNPKELIQYSIGGLNKLYKNSTIPFTKLLFQIGRVRTAETYKGEIYIGTQTGLFRADVDKSWVSANLLDKEDRVNDIKVYGDQLLIGTSFSGLLVGNGKKWRHYKTKQGLLDNEIKKIVICQSGGFWIVTKNGAQKFLIEDGKPIEVNRQDFRTELHVVDVNSFFEFEGKIYVGFAGNNVSLDLMEKPALPKLRLYLDAVYSSERRLDRSKEIHLPAGSNQIKFNFSGINFTKHKTLYIFRLNNGPWIESWSGNVDFPYLMAGKYTLEIYAKTLFYSPSNTIKVNFQIDQYWYLKPWVLVLEFLALIALIFVLIRWQLITYYRRKRQLVNLELASLQSQMNPHFTFNTLTSIQNFILNNDVRASMDYLSDFSHLMRRILEQARLQIVPLSEEISFLKVYISLEQKRMEHSFDYTILVDANLQPDSVGIPSMLLQPFIENAIWHGLGNKKEKGHLEVHFGQEYDKLVVRISDDGVGRENAKTRFKAKHQHQSRGMSITQDRIELFKKLYKQKVNFTVTDLNVQERTGTIVRIELPLLKTFVNKQQPD